LTVLRPTTRGLRREPRAESATLDDRILGSAAIEAPDGSTVEARLRVVDGGRVSEAELAAIHAALRRGFGDWPTFEVGGSSFDHLSWKIAGRRRRRNAALVWEIGSAVVGVSLELYRELLVRGVERMGRVGADSSVDQAWRGRGLNLHRQRIAAPFREGRAAISMGTTNNRRGVHFRSDNRVLHTPIRVLLSVSDPWRLASAWRERGGRRFPRPVAAAALWGMQTLATVKGLLMRRPLRRAADASGVRLRPADRFDERVDELFEAAARDFDLIVVRRHDYLNWRFCDERAGSYAVWLAEAETGDELLGYVVTRRDGSRGYVVDLLARPGRLDVVDALLDRALRELRAGGATGVLCWMVEDHPYMQALRRHGFFDSRRDPRFIFRACGMPAEELTFLHEPGARVHLTHGDTDVI